MLLLCLAVNDVSFLLIHFFEDTLRTYRDIYIDKENSNTTLNSFVIAINLIDKSDLTCRIVNYLRYVLRFISSYILVAFTLQRLLIIFNPMTSVFRHKKSAWITVLITVISSFLINFWALFLFEIQTHEDKSNYCDIKKRWSTEYVLITAIYICLTLFIPIIIILGTNLLIILNLQKSEIKRKECNSVSSKHQNNNGKRYDSLRVNKKVLHNFSLEMKSKNSYRFRIKPYYSNINKIANKTNNSKNSTRILLTISFVFILLNLPYLISWILFYYRVAFRDNDPELKDYLFATLQISEIFYVSNYAISFYLYCISGSKFRNQLKYSSNIYFRIN